MSKEEWEEFEDECKYKYYVEVVVVVVFGYGFYECYEKRDVEDRLEEFGYDFDGKKK